MTKRVLEHLKKEGGQDCSRRIELLSVQLEQTKAFLAAHIKLAKDEQQAFKELVAAVPANPDSLLIAMDFKQTRSLPFLKRQPAALFYRSNFAMHVLGICDLTHKQNTICFAGEDVQATRTPTSSSPCSTPTLTIILEATNSSSCVLTVRRTSSALHWSTTATFWCSGARFEW